MKIPFNKPYITGSEIENITEVLQSGHLSGNGQFTKRCMTFFREMYDFKKCLLTTSCTDALEMAAILLKIGPGDEIIMPSYTFVSTANAFVLRGAKIVFVDSRTDHPGMDENEIERLVTSKTKVIVPVHYAGISCDMDKILDLASNYKLNVVEDAAQAIDSTFKSRNGTEYMLGTMGQFGTFSFHETKNISCGEGGMLVINDEDYFERAEIIWEKGTNRVAFHRGEVNKYVWKDIGSSFLASDITAAFLLAQLKHLTQIQKDRKRIWHQYMSTLEPWAVENDVMLPKVPSYATINGHLFYIVFKTVGDRTKMIEHLKSKGIHSVFHYLSLHKSEFYSTKHDNRNLPWSDYYSERLLRLPLWCGMTNEEMQYIINAVRELALKS